MKRQSGTIDISKHSAMRRIHSAQHLLEKLPPSVNVTEISVLLSEAMREVDRLVDDFRCAQDRAQAVEMRAGTENRKRRT